MRLFSQYVRRLLPTRTVLHACDALFIFLFFVGGGGYCLVFLHWGIERSVGRASFDLVLLVCMLVKVSSLGV